MRFQIHCLFLLLPAFAALTAGAADFVWPGHGTISFDVPASWSLHGKQAADAGYNFTARPNSQAAVVLQVTLAETPADHPVPADSLTGQLREMVSPYLGGSVEGKFNPQALKLRQGQGWFVQLTDASLVGKPPEPENYKVMRNALVALDEHALVVVTMQCDNPNSREAAEMTAIVSSMRFVRGTRANELTSKQKAGNFEFTVPESRVRVTMPEGGLTSDTDRIGGSTNNPRYFKLSGESPNLIVSGWFESEQRYKGLKQFWAEEMGAWNKNIPPPQEIAFTKIGNWDVITYSLRLPSATSYNARAESVQSGTWIDLHLSTTTDQDAATAKEQLLAALRTIKVTEK